MRLPESKPGNPILHVLGELLAGMGLKGWGLESGTRSPDRNHGHGMAHGANSLETPAGSPGRHGLTQGIGLPELGNSVSGEITLDEERNLGRMWLSQFRGQVPPILDPVLQNYLENLTLKLTPYSQLQDQHLWIELVDSEQINAFAVPGGVLGLHNGLLLHADSEDEVAGVIAHELGHLSQRHYARRLAEERKLSLASMAGLLAGMVLAATGVGIEAMIASISAGQALSLQQQLQFSREQEKEADRVGISTLAEAGYDPRAVPNFFERLQKQSSYQEIPEFLLTHPVTESRIADSRNRINRLSSQSTALNFQQSSDLDFQLAKTRVEMRFQASPEAAIQFFSARHKSSPQDPAANYGLALALTRTGKTNEAEALLQPLLKQNPANPFYLEARAQLLAKDNRHDELVTMLRPVLQVYPENYPLSYLISDALLTTGKATEARRILERQLRRRPLDVHLWQLLTRAQGQLGNITGTHSSRAEYLVLTGEFDQAIQQLSFALEKTEGNYPEKLRIRERIAQVKTTKEELENF